MHPNQLGYKRGKRSTFSCKTIPNNLSVVSTQPTEVKSSNLIPKILLPVSIAILLVFFSNSYGDHASPKQRFTLEQVEELHQIRTRLESRKVRTRVCLNMIAKDESKRRLIPALKAASLHITGYIFCDTGSTDGTPEIAKSLFDELRIQGKVVNHGWKDFSHNRNLCLKDGKRMLRRVCDYWLLLDADQIMVSTDEISLSELVLTEAGYWLRELGPNAEYSNRRIVKINMRWRYVGKVHEYIETNQRESSIGFLPSTIYSIHQSDLKRGFDKDAALLESALKENPQDSRARFYLGNTYSALGRKEDAMVQWILRTEMGGWQEERYMSALWVAGDLDSYRQQNKTITGIIWNALVRTNLVKDKERGNEDTIAIDLQDVVQVYKKAHALLPYRQEALYYLSKLSRVELQQYDACYGYANDAILAGMYNELTLFAEIHVYKYHVKDELCVCGYYASSLEMINGGRKACQALIDELEQMGAQEESAPQWLQNMHSRTLDNLKFYAGAIM